MKSELIPSTANHISTIMQAAKKTCKQWCPCALVVVLLSALFATASAQAQTFTVLYSFKGGADGAYPQAGVIRDTAGNLYGTTFYGGDPTCSSPFSGCGIVFKLDATRKETLLYSFTGQADGAHPAAGLIRDTAGNLCGTTGGGGDLTCFNGFGCGTVFKLDATGKETVLYSFTGSPDGLDPIAGLVRDAEGNLYGTTGGGGGGTCSGSGCGTVFKLDATGKETVLYNFGTGGADGAVPGSLLIRDAAGNLYGTTISGGASSLGTVFKLDSTGKVTVLHSFTGGADGETPDAGLIPNGADLYGTTANGGASGSGTVFKIDKTGKETVLHSFAGGADGEKPVASLIHDAAGNLYGTTEFGGTSSRGTVFKLDATGKETVLHSFAGYPTDGSYPFAGLVRDAAGNLYGTTLGGGASGLGTVFKIAP
jgi:uncharacterized repeat protein (TIGR03803 family)